MLQQPFELSVLIWPTLAIFLSVYFISIAALRRPDAAFAIALFKASIYLIYFSWIFDGYFTYLDDWTYIRKGIELHERIGLANSLSDFTVLKNISEGDHFVYYIHNSISFSLFGIGYFAPVALNVIFTSAIAFVGARIAIIESMIPQKSNSWFFAFLILHPDLTAWSTIVNAKDIFVLLLHVLLIYSISLGTRHYYFKAIAVGGASVFILPFLRFYVPLIFLFALIPIFIFRPSGPSVTRFLALALAVFISFIFGIGASSLNDAVDSMRTHFVNPVVGLARFLLTPIPFNTETSFEFLNIPSLIHWILVPAMFAGAIKIFTMRTQFSIFIIIYFLAFFGLYSVYGELQGPRHRIQLDYAIALFQFVGILILRNLINTRREIFIGENSLHHGVDFR